VSGTRRRGSARPVACQEAVEAISARMDGEALPVAARDLDAHLASCAACRHFAAEAVALGRQVRLRPARPVPVDLTPKLAALLEAPAPALPREWKSRFARGAGPGWAGRAQWAGATMSVAFVALAISLGVGSHPRLVPTRPPSPCTVGLLAHHRPRGS